MRTLFVYLLASLLVLFTALGFYMFSLSAELGGFLLFISGVLALILGLIYLSFRWSVGELKDSITQAIGRAARSPIAGQRTSRVRR